MKVSIIMPTYNDSDSIINSINSVLEQDYSNLELIIVNDGSTDNTEDVIKSLKDERIKYIYQENADQLNAVSNGFEHSTGDIIYILHSDDLFFNNKTISNAVKEMKETECQALKGDLITINEKDEETGIIKVRDFSDRDIVLSRMFLLYGMNILNDFAFIKREAFEEFSYNNYLLWNTPFWVKFNDKSYECIKIHKSKNPLIKYRIHEENYINNDLGKFNVVNGNIRTLMYLMDRYSIPFFSLNRFLLRARKDSFKPKYKLKPTKNKYKIIKKAIEFRVGDVYKENIYLVSLISFYKNLQSLKGKDKVIKLTNEIKVEDIYYGKDMRKFNKDIINNTLPEIYYEIFEQMKEGFNTIKVRKSQKENLENILKFLSIYVDVKILEG